MIVLRAYKTELDLNNAQETNCMCHAGAARFAYQQRQKAPCFSKGALREGLQIYS
jgi:hypothetical protein